MMTAGQSTGCSPQRIFRARGLLLLGMGLVGSVASAAASHPAVPLIESAVIEMRTDPEASKRDSEAALRLLERQPDVDLEIQARLVLCDYQAERDSAAAAHEIEAATALLPRARRSGIRAGLLDCQGQMSETDGDNATARQLYERAVSVATATHDDEMLAESLFSRGYLRGLQGEYAPGLSDLRRAQALFDRLKKPLHSLTTLNSIAILYNRMGDYAAARAIYSSALQAQHAAGMKREEAVTLHNLGRADENLHDWPDAKQAFTDSLALSGQLGYVRGEAYALRGLAAVANAAGDPQGALETLDRAAQLQRQTPDARLYGQIQLARGIALHKLQRLAQSLTVLEEASQVFRRADALGELNATYAELADVYAESGNWRAAFERESEAKQTAERLLNNQLDQRFATLKVEFDTAAKDKENVALLRENRANEQALTQGRAVRRLQAAVIALSATLVLLLTTLAVYQRRSTLRMRHLAMTDELTGVPNRRSVLNRLEPLLRSESTMPCATLIVDIDHFKRINDQYGHPVGDEVLKRVAERLKGALAEPAFFGRLGGEEFLIVLPQTDLIRAYSVAESLREHVLATDTTRWFADGRLITASIGCAVSSEPGETPSSMLSRADTALYAAKRAGRNCVRSDPAAPESVGPLLAQTP